MAVNKSFLHALNNRCPLLHPMQNHHGRDAHDSVHQLVKHYHLHASRLSIDNLQLFQKHFEGVRDSPDASLR